MDGGCASSAIAMDSAGRGMTCSASSSSGWRAIGSSYGSGRRRAQGILDPAAEYLRLDADTAHIALYRSELERALA
jgi:hypothetical protein